MHPAYRRKTEALGKWLSYVRFLYIGLHRASFRDEVLSELLPPLEPDGTSLLWEALGRHFTGHVVSGSRSRLAVEQRVHPRALPGRLDLHLAACPKPVQGLIGQVGPETKGVEKMLRRIGFEYADRIDPFDGGPHFIAKTDDITLVKATRTARVVALPAGEDAGAADRAGLGRARPRAALLGGRARASALEGTDVGLPAATMKLLGRPARRQRRRPALPMSDPATRASDELAAAELRDTDDRTRALGELWRDRPALVLWVRHFG